MHTHEGLMTLSIGVNAGKIWSALNMDHELALEQLRTRLNLDECSLYAAIGWLAREGKIFCCERNNTVYFSNKSEMGFYGF